MISRKSTDNQAFRNLVNEYKPKTTKDLAREAVELEFEEKKRKRRREARDGDVDGFSSNEEDKSSNFFNDNKNGGNGIGGSDDKYTSWKKGRRKKNKIGNENSEGLKYRDRAKERREGKNLDYESSTDRPENHDSTPNYNVEMTKFLGGDEAYTHLVKGLDKTLAEKVRRDEMGVVTSDIHEKNEDFDEVLEGSVDRSESSKELSRNEPVNLILQKIANKVRNPSQNFIGDRLNLLAYVERVHKQKGGLGMSNSRRESAEMTCRDNDISKTIHRSTLSFSSKADHRDRLNAWEMPKETIMSSAQNERLYGDRMSDDVSSQNDTCTPIRGDLLKNIKKIFEDVVKKQNKAPSQRLGFKNQHGMCKKRKNKVHGESDAEHRRGVDLRRTEQPIEVDSDDDIFRDIGEYIPPSSVK